MRQRHLTEVKFCLAEDLEKIEEFGRYLDVDGDGIPYRTIPGTHPTKGSFFTRGTSRDEYARYTEAGDAYVRNVDRLLRKFETAKDYVPAPEISGMKYSHGIIFFGTTYFAALEAEDILAGEGLNMDTMRIKAFPFNKEVEIFIDQHEEIFIVEQNRDEQLRKMLIIELSIPSEKLIPILNYDGSPIAANNIAKQIMGHVSVKELS